MLSHIRKSQYFKHFLNYVWVGGWMGVLKLTKKAHTSTAKDPNNR